MPPTEGGKDQTQVPKTNHTQWRSGEREGVEPGTEEVEGRKKRVSGDGGRGKKKRKV